MKSVSPWWVYTLMSLLSFFPSSFIFKAWLPGDLFCVCIAVRSARDRGCAQFSQARKTSPLYGESCMWPGKSIRVQGIFKSALVFTSTGTHVFSMQVFRLCCEANISQPSSVIFHIETLLNSRLFSNCPLDISRGHCITSHTRHVHNHIYQSP